MIRHVPARTDADHLRDEILHNLLDGRAKYKAPPAPADPRAKRPVTLPTLKEPDYLA